MSNSSNSETLFAKTVNVSARNVVRIQTDGEEIMIAWHGGAPESPGPSSPAQLDLDPQQAAQLLTDLRKAAADVESGRIRDFSIELRGVLRVLYGGEGLQFVPEWGGMYHVEPAHIQEFIGALDEAMGALSVAGRISMDTRLKCAGISLRYDDLKDAIGRAMRECRGGVSELFRQAQRVERLYGGQASPRSRDLRRQAQEELERIEKDDPRMLRLKQASVDLKNGNPHSAWALVKNEGD